MTFLPAREPDLSVGLVSNAKAIRLRLLGRFDLGGRRAPAGNYEVKLTGGVLSIAPASMDGDPLATGRELHLIPLSELESRFEIEATIGIGFHWEQTELQTFCGALRLCYGSDGRLTVVNEVPLETYLRSVVCSEMSASSPIELIRAHAIVSRSWLLAQLSPKPSTGAVASRRGEMIRIYDRESHADFMVCADDHCQRYQGMGRIMPDSVSGAIDDTRGSVLVYGGEVCDARFSKCCGGVTEAYRAAWQDRDIPYLSPIGDAADRKLPTPSLSDESVFRRFLTDPPPSFCNCDDSDLLRALLPHSDIETEFYRWRERREVHELARLLGEKGNIDIGRPLRLEPVERGTSGRLVRVRITGDRGEIVVGKELEIRRLLSPSHLRSSAFLAETVGDPDSPDAFILHGAGWGHGVGLCQIGAAVMASRGYGHLEIMRHYFQGVSLVQAYE